MGLKPPISDTGRSLPTRPSASGSRSRALLERDEGPSGQVPSERRRTPRPTRRPGRWTGVAAPSSSSARPALPIDVVMLSRTTRVGSARSAPRDCSRRSPGPPRRRGPACQGQRDRRHPGEHLRLGLHGGGADPHDLLHGLGALADQVLTAAHCVENPSTMTVRTGFRPRLRRRRRPWGLGGSDQSRLDARLHRRPRGPHAEDAHQRAGDPAGERGGGLRADPARSHSLDRRLRSQEPGTASQAEDRAADAGHRVRARVLPGADLADVRRGRQVGAGGDPEDQAQGPEAHDSADGLRRRQRRADDRCEPSRGEAGRRRGGDRRAAQALGLRVRVVRPQGLPRAPHASRLLASFIQGT